MVTPETRLASGDAAFNRPLRLRYRNQPPRIAERDRAVKATRTKPTIDSCWRALIFCSLLLGYSDRLVNDGRVSGKNKVLLGSGIAYYVFPIDLIPEAFVGPIGYLDDLVFGVYILNRILADTDAAILREHWPGSDDVLTMIQKVLGTAESLVGTQILDRIKRMAK